MICSEPGTQKCCDSVLGFYFLQSQVCITHCMKLVFLGGHLVLPLFVSMFSGTSASIQNVKNLHNTYYHLTQLNLSSLIFTNLVLCSFINGNCWILVRFTSRGICIPWTHSSFMFSQFCLRVRHIWLTVLQSKMSYENV